MTWPTSRAIQVRKHIVALSVFLCAAAARAASKWPDHEWLIGSSGVAWSNPEACGGTPQMEMWFVFRGSERYVHLPLIPFVVLAAFLGSFMLWMYRHRSSRN